MPSSGGFQFIAPDWPAPERVKSVLTTRFGGASEPPFEAFNLGDHVGDSAQSVAANRESLLREISAQSVFWLNQVHGVDVVQVAEPSAVVKADASWSRTPGIACAVLTADCLPVLLCDDQASVVAAVHGGWRGLVAGVLEQTLAALPVGPSQVMAYLGPAIGVDQYEVGLEVVEAILHSAKTPGLLSALKTAISPSAKRPLHFQVDLYQLARMQLQHLGVERVYGGEFCTYQDPRFYSYRQQPVTGRQASLIWLEP